MADRISPILKRAFPYFWHLHSSIVKNMLHDASDLLSGLP
jgi:hypothetical protein